jgi:hypothetical protein
LPEELGAVQTLVADNGFFSQANVVARAQAWARGRTVRAAGPNAVQPIDSAHVRVVTWICSQSPILGRLPMRAAAAALTFSERQVPAAAHQCCHAQLTRAEMMQRFAVEITELRALGFAEGFSSEPPYHERGLVARLESGRIGCAVEFCTRDGTPTYAVVPLLVGSGNGSSVATDIWGDIVRNICRRAPLGDND